MDNFRLIAPDALLSVLVRLERNWMPLFVAARAQLHLHEITLLGCLVSLTPGTLTLDLSGDRKTLFVHAMFVRDYGRTIASIKDGYEKRILRLMRCRSCAAKVRPCALRPGWRR